MRLRCGRKIAVPLQKKGATLTVKDLIRRHLREEGKNIADLAIIWGVHRHTAYNVMYRRSSTVGPDRVAAVVNALRLDDFDRDELNVVGAIEAGWQISRDVL